jgi:arylsulfatase A-like enzyme
MVWLQPAHRFHKYHLFLLAAFAALVLPGPVTAQTQPKRPNVLFIAVDDLNDWIGAMGGHPQTKTPNLDRLAKKGVMFTRAYCPAPSCNPSRAALLSGKRPATSGVYVNDQPWRPVMPDVVTLPAYFLRHGYAVWGGGKIFHGGFPDDKAFSDYFKGKAKFPKQLPPNGIGGNMMWGPLDAGDEVMPDTQLTDWAIQKLKQKHDKPFFLAVGYVKPHLAWHAPKKYFDMHPLDKVQLPTVNPKDLDDIPPAGIKMAKPGGDHKQIVDKGVWKEAVQAYLSSISFLDAQVGRLIEAFESSEYANNTIIIFWSDHGWHLGEKEHWRKFALWERATRVPLFMVAPGLTKANQQCQRTVNLMDMYPTLIELCGLPKKSDIEANSLVPLLKNPQSKWDHPSVMTWGRNNHAVRDERWRYIRYADGTEELYDHDRDPHEWTNLAKDAKFDTVKKGLAVHLPKVNAPDAPHSKVNKKKKDKKDETSSLLEGKTAQWSEPRWNESLWMRLPSLRMGLTRSASRSQTPVWERVFPETPVSARR